jgi:hypothetical protein
MDKLCCGAVASDMKRGKFLGYLGSENCHKKKKMINHGIILVTIRKLLLAL